MYISLYEQVPLLQKEPKEQQNYAINTENDELNTYFTYFALLSKANVPLPPFSI